MILETLDQQDQRVTQDQREWVLRDPQAHLVILDQRVTRVTQVQQVPHPQSQVQRVLTLRSLDPLGLRDPQERVVAAVAVQSRSLAQQDLEVS